MQIFFHKSKRSMKSNKWTSTFMNVGYLFTTFARKLIFFLHFFTKPFMRQKHINFFTLCSCKSTLTSEGLFKKILSFRIRRKILWRKFLVIYLEKWVKMLKWVILFEEVILWISWVNLTKFYRATPGATIIFSEN